MKNVKPDATEEEIIHALKLACAWDFIKRHPDGINGKIGERGSGLSEGQSQRIAIARAILRDAPIMLLDEATSALDNETQENIKKAINNLQGQYTILIIAHRLSTIINSDKIML